MTLARGLSLLADLVFVGVFASVLVEVVRTRRRVLVDVALFFAAGVIAIGLGFLVSPMPAVQKVQAVAVLAMPVALLHVVNEFTVVPRLVIRLVWAGFIACILLVLALSPPYPGPAVSVIIGYLVVAYGYATWRFAIRARTAPGARKHRKQAVATGTVLLAALFIISGLRTRFPAYADTWTILGSLCFLACTLAYFIGFAPPRLLRRGWQHAQVIDGIVDLDETAAAARTFPDLIRGLEQSLASAIGTPTALISVWDAEAGRLRAPSLEEPVLSDERASTSLAFRSFRDGIPIFVDDAGRADPANRETYRRFGITTLLVAPLLVGNERIGVVSLFGDRPPLFAQDDVLTLVALVGPVGAVIHNWQLSEQRSAAMAYEESLTLEREFLSAAAHELRTPLTSILGESQLLLRRIDQQGTDRVRESADRIAGQARRMRELVNDLLNVSRESATGFVTELRPADMLDIVRDVATEFRFTDVSGESAVAPVDHVRMEQVIRNLLDNARKYSPEGSPINIRVENEGERVLIAVQDRGIGIPTSEQTRIFERFVRGAAPMQHTSDGIGLGLYLCRRIVEEHGGRIWVESHPGEGSTFYVDLPAAQPTEPARALSTSPQLSNLASS